MHYMLDTNACIGIIKGKPANLRKNMMRHVPTDMAISQMVYYELRYGVCHSRQPQRNQANLEQFLRYIQILDWHKQQSIEAADIRCELACKGAPIGHYDILIAAHARSLKLTLITHNVREFQRVDGLSFEDWEIE